MNRFAKACFESIKQLATDEQMFFYNECFSLEETILIRRTTGKATFRDVLCHYYSHYCTMDTICGPRTCYESGGVDRLAAVELEVFGGGFYFDSRLGAFKPGIKNITVSRCIADHVLFKSEYELKRSWNEIKGSLYSAATSGRDLVEATMIAEPDKGQHLYFIHDSVNEQVKIGISYFPGIRVKQVARHYGRGALSILHIVQGGGRELEAELHKKFELLRVEGEREWFHYKKPITKFLDEIKVG
ncbi:GIY-YIG nuclease family protein [Pseudomonas aeruginosa]